MNDNTYRLPNWDGPHEGPPSAGACALTAAYKRYVTLTPERILQIARNAAHCDPQRIPMPGYMPTQSLQYHLDLARRLLIVFPRREDWDEHPVRIYTHGQMTVRERTSFISDIVGNFIEQLVALEGPGQERAMLASVK